MGGGPSREQKQAAAAQAEATRAASKQSGEALAFQKEQTDKIDPWATSRLNNGLPFFPAMMDYTSGTNAQAFAPARAQLLRRLGGQDLPSGFKEQALSDLEAQRARAFDSGITQNLFANEQSMQDAARTLTGQAQLVNPLGWAQAGMQGNSSIMQAPLQSPGVAGLLGGIAGGVASKIPF